MSSTSNAALTADRIWLDGRLIPWSQGQVPIMTHALHYGLGVFEGIRAYRTHDGRLAVFRLREHMRRFADSAHIIQLKMPFSEEEMVQACLELLRAQRDRLVRLCRAAVLEEPEFLADELFLLLEGARVSAQSVGRDGHAARLVRMGDAIIASLTPR